ncbi:pentapeptide repeat-containing protein [Streptomyces sp. GMY02]|uniref:pentapeptide repeat-containing protein n=1 Tax=Streptomyces sp. GMY02 TaxID=1333528 RepID=UPI001C2C7902|nr:pentapeptide repeat-containing protein [Streptomyces sp. GMY02]QXE36454.1 pentapeptide repeat-containing protein [Streptomyces sp. GMY02]
MDFTSWGDWARALVGATVMSAALVLIWRVVVKAAAFSDPHRRTGRHVVLVPRRLIRPRTETVGRLLRVSMALRRHQGLNGTRPTARFVNRLVELDRSERVLQAGRRVWAQVIPFLLFLCGAALALWLLVADDGPASELLDLDDILYDTLGSDGWYVEGDSECPSWTVLRGCESWPAPWWSGTESGLAFGIAVAWLLGALTLRWAATRRFNSWEKDEPPILGCLRALVACRDALRPLAPEASILDMCIAELRAALRDFARQGPPADPDRRADLEEHAAQAAGALHNAMGQVLRDGTAALPTLIELLAVIQDRLADSRWLALLDQSMLTGTPGPGPAPAPGSAPPPPVADSGRWQRYTAIATALPTVPALLALAFTTVTISQANDMLKLTERGQVGSTYNETVAQLGDESINVRISTIYAIQRIMRESPKEQPALMEVLSSYIREHAKMPEKKKAEQLRKNAKTRPADDVQAALTVLGGREVNTESDPIINLRDTFLVGADLSYVNFVNADLSGVDLTHAFLQGGEFEDVWFDEAQMSGAVLSDGDFEDCDFIGTHLRDVQWDGADFENADLTDADLVGASLAEREDVAVIDLRYAELSGADLTNADLTGAYLMEADLGKDSEQKLPAAKLTGTNFTDADLTGASLDGTDRRRAVWDGAILP